MELVKNKLILLFFFIFQISLAQIPCLENNFILNKYIDAFIYVNNDNNFKPNKSLIHIASFYSKYKGYTIVITRDNIEAIMVNPKASNQEILDYKKFDLVLKGENPEGLAFLKKIIKDTKTTKSSKIKFITPNNNITSDPYQWYFLFDKNMNLINYYLTDGNIEIESIFKKFDISTNKIEKNLK